VTERRRSEQQVAHLAHHDPLTDLPNRTLLRERLVHELKRVKRGESIAVLALDLDYFKTINDTLGHPIGDELLKLVADRLRSSTRDPDTVARLGGDEFAIIMTQLHKPLDATILARRIRESVSRPFHVDGHQIVTDISIGISVAPEDGTEPDVLLKNADMALYGAKEDGRGTWRFFEAEMDTKMRARRDLEMSLRSALANGEFKLHYQPLVTIGNNEVAAFEALIRWNRSENQMVSPADFIPIAEETGLIIPIGEWVLRSACMEAAKWPPHIKVAVNISPAQLSNRNIVATVSSALAAAQLLPERLQLEVTETVLLQDTFSTLSRLHQLHELGVQIALDDFGTGYSSLSYLRSFPFDKIKIDRSFIKDLGTGEEPFAIVNAVAGLAKGLKIASTAEGVETTRQLEILQGIGCTEIQGYLFSRPLPAEDVSRFLVQSMARSGAA
jgi:diguanylate cyclase (GGDEF)-like protein